MGRGTGGGAAEEGLEGEVRRVEVLLLASLLFFFISFCFLFPIPSLLFVCFFLSLVSSEATAHRQHDSNQSFPPPSLCDLLLAFILYIYLLFFLLLPPAAQKGFKLLHEKFIPGSQEIRGLTGHLLRPS